MGAKKKLILEELKKTAKTLGKERFSRDDFYKHTALPITQNDIENEFGSFAEAMVAANFKPVKWAKISDEQLFKAYGEVYEKLGHFPLGHPGEAELEKLTDFSGGVFRKRFGGLKNFLFEFKNWQLENSNKNIFISIKESVKVSDNLSISSTEIKTEYFENKGRYAGKAAENLVVAELLFRGFNAQILQVDEGIDVFAVNVKKNELYLIQVKHSHYDTLSRSGTISVTVSSFEKNKRSNVYYIFVLERDVNKRDFLILPFHKVDELMKNGSINKVENSKQVSFSVLHRKDEDAFIGKISEITDVSRYLNAWDVLL